MANRELGIKRLCASCGAKFDDLNKDPIRCPKCRAVYEVVVAIRPVRPTGPMRARPPVPEKTPAPAPRGMLETVRLSRRGRCRGAGRRQETRARGSGDRGARGRDGRVARRRHLHRGTGRRGRRCHRHHRRRHRKQGRRVNQTKPPPGEASHFRPHIDIQSPMGAGLIMLRPTHARSC